MQKKFFPPKRDFSSLSLKDLLEARDAYHTHLAHLDNVIATAIGRYRIRVKDPDSKEARGPKAWRDRMQSPERTLGNTVIKAWSWPSLLVFVKEWFTLEEMVRQDPEQVVPRFLYLSDGRVVPTCVILAERQEKAPPPLQNITFPEHLVGGGYPVFTENQGQQHIGSIGCLVSDGDSVYALTNRHVTGELGREVFSFIGGKKMRVGISSRSRLDDRVALGKRLFQDVYPGWPGQRSYVNIDAGLIHVEDLEYWTSQVFGIGELGDPVDLNTDTLSLDLIGCPVRAFGAASGEMVGEISALFYRYKSVGGFDYISDLLIGPRTESCSGFWEAEHDEGEHEVEYCEPNYGTVGESGVLKTRPGDSGTLWFFDQNMTVETARSKGYAGARARRLRPIALQWGGHTLLDEKSESKAEFALATCLSTICRELDLDVIPDFDIGHSEYWGKTGHYKIAAKACELVADPKLKKLLLANVSNIAFGDEAIEQGELQKVKPVSPSKPNQPFVPLADVPDIVWRASRKLDDANHFADMDQEGEGDFAGKTLLRLCQNPDNVDISVWNGFYDSLGIGRKRGAAPFRVWQIYKLMVEFVRKKKVAEFVCAGGIVSHYVGDSCQPLHVSFLHHGREGHPEEEKVHSVYETQMIDKKATEIIVGINEALKNTKAKADVTGGHAAAVSVVELMRQTVKTLKPIKVIEAFNDAQQNNRIPDMWNALGAKTITCMAGGCLRMASIWASAWKEGGGGNIANSKLVAIEHDELMSLYNDKNFLPAFRLQDEEFAEALQE
ncbi:MAG TPA: hypothetical protein VF791_20535 [Pyrinomonadaceae bacterium]